MTLLHSLFEMINEEYIHCVSNSIAIFGQDVKDQVHIWIYVPMSSTICQPVHGIVINSNLSSAVDHDWYYEKNIPLVTPRMNLTSDEGNCLYSGGKDEEGIAYSCVYDETID